MRKTKRKITIPLLLAFGFTVLTFATDAQVRPIYDRGSMGLGQLLKKLQTTASVMHTGAHPDDEDSGLMAYLARKEQARTVYLSLTRGDGGQNVIGEELFEPLGVIRTEELLQARILDGGEQMFTRAMDYGYSKKREEAAALWGEKLILGDMVRAIRLFRPYVLISRFSGTRADGHGQHQFAGYLTPLAFKAAADPTMFPEHFEEGLRPWQIRKLYVGRGFRPNPNNAPTLLINTGEYDPLIGRSYLEIALEGRSQHKSQEMGLIEIRGKRNSGLRLSENLASRVEKEKSVFDGLDISIKGIAELTSNNEEMFLKHLSELHLVLASAVAKYDQFRPNDIVPVLSEALRKVKLAISSTKNPDSRFILSKKQKEIEDTLLLASGTVIDVLSDSEKIVAGDSRGLSVKIFAPENARIKVNDIRLTMPAGWKSETVSEPPKPTGRARFFIEDASFAAYFKVTAPRDAQVSQPYWLKDHRGKAYTFNWKTAGSAKNLPFQSPLLAAEIKLRIDDAELVVKRKAEYRYADDIRGELRRNLNVVPAVSIGLKSDLLIAPRSSNPAKYNVVMTVVNNKDGATNGKATIELPEGWNLSPRSEAFSLKQRGAKATVGFDVEVPRDTEAKAYKLTAIATVDGKRFDQRALEIAYPHIQSHRVYSPSEVTAQVLNLKVAPVRVGYIMGSGDKIPDAIRRLGLEVTMLDEKELSTGNLNEFDTIVVGVRASQVRPDFVSNNARLIQFVRNGGTLIVQYQQYEFVRKGLVPFPAKMARNSRTVDENAPVKILEPNHPVFNFPNKISQADFSDWVQERHLYSLTEWDNRYQPLLESHDEGEADSKGGMLYTEIGKGKYFYSSYSWFRQLPKGVPGAYRIFANMLSQPKIVRGE
ncbi:MAG: PIG-L family deacetylase [Pyrinomonadaceae bacterium]|nr:PIG-L family deacetylase [Pyrinomonadaceae bacterium]